MDAPSFNPADPPRPPSPPSWATYLVRDIPDDTSSDIDDPDFEVQDQDDDEEEGDEEDEEDVQMRDDAPAVTLVSSDDAQAEDSAEPARRLTPEEILARPPVPPASPYVEGYFQSANVSPALANGHGSRRELLHHRYPRSQSAAELRVPLASATPEQLIAEIHRLNHEQQKSKADLQSAHAHNTLLYKENHDLRTQFATKEAKRKSKANTIVGGTMTIAMGPITAPEQHAFQLKRIADNAAATQQKKDAERSRMTKLAADKEARFSIRSNLQHTWTGTWKTFQQSTAKNLMMTLAEELHIPYSETDTKQAIGDAIASHFSSHTDTLLNNPRYSTLVRSFKGIAPLRVSRGRQTVATPQDPDPVPGVPVPHVRLDLA